MKLLVGSTGVVGTTLQEQLDFNQLFNSRNLQEILSIKTEESELYLSCLPAQKWIVNQNVEKDLANILNIISILSQKKFKKIFLISTIDVYTDTSFGASEGTVPVVKNLCYGTNRYLFELLVEKLNYKELKIFRLPAIFNRHIKKNILYDLINNNNVEKINTNSAYQWYHLDNLQKDIDTLCLKYPGKKIFNLFPQPVETKEIVKMFPKVKCSSGSRVEYNYNTEHFNTGYMINNKVSLQQIEDFINETCR